MTLEQHFAPAALLTALFIGSVPAHAQDEQAQRAQLDQRLKLVAGLLSDSRSAQRIATSGNAEAVAHLDEGRVHHALAADLLAKGDLAGARKAADHALHHLGLARRSVPDAPARLEAAKQRHEQLLASVERFVETLRARAGGAEASDLTAAIGLLDVARQHARAGRYEDANQTLGAAERHVLAGMNRTLHAATLDYTVRASSPLEEFQNELARHQSLVDLVPLAVRDLRPRPDAMTLIDRYGETRATLYGQAMQRFQAGEVADALIDLRNATLYVQRALLAAGLVAPQPTGNPP